jgi:hypothetical protein
MTAGYRSRLALAGEKLRSHGVEMPWRIEDRSGSRWVMFHDPAGNLIELAQIDGR